mmetsp:Transcript_113796/g.322270  ORF Transcript_113796/g.322270 Transcript_113796/m.322270 type:complete len:229 (+) Transcript_113796:594-1280(+)
MLARFPRWRARAAPRGGAGQRRLGRRRHGEGARGVRVAGAVLLGGRADLNANHRLHQEPAGEKRGVPQHEGRRAGDAGVPVERHEAAGHQPVPTDQRLGRAHAHRGPGEHPRPPLQVARREAGHRRLPRDRVHVREELAGRRRHHPRAPGARRGRARRARLEPRARGFYRRCGAHTAAGEEVDERLRPRPLRPNPGRLEPRVHGPQPRRRPGNARGYQGRGSGLGEKA